MRGGEKASGTFTIKRKTPPGVINVQSDIF